jgi:ectoine hydroxylase
MHLSADQLCDFDEQGYLFFPNCFSEEEIALLRDDAEAILKLDRQEVWREKTGAPRTAFAAHTFNETFRLLASHPRLVEPLRQLFGEDVYVHQFKLNAKAAFEGDVWQWHQDYGTWARDDGMPQARAMNIAVFLCAVSNHITKFTRPEWIAHRDFTPIAPVTDDALLAHARSRRVAAE